MDGREGQQRLSVSFQGSVMVLRRDTPRFTFGRSAECRLRIDDPGVSRHAGAIAWVDALRMIYNDSRTRPFDVVVDGTPNPVHPCTSGDVRSSWAIGPRPVKIQLAAGRGRLHELELEPEPPVVPHPRASDDELSSSTPVVREPSPHERLLLAARFLALPEPGEALRSNEEAAGYATAARPPWDPRVTAPAVAMVVWRWRRILTELGVQNLADDSTLGRQLLAWDVLRQEDRRLLLTWRG